MASTVRKPNLLTKIQGVVRWSIFSQKSYFLGKPKEIDLDGPFGSKDPKFLINVPTELPSFDVGFLIATIFGKLKLPYLPYLPA